MEEEALEYAHGLFTKDGYNGSLDEYKELVSTNEEALDYSFDLFTKDGYKDDKSTFTSLLGVSGEEVKKKQTSELDGEEVETTTISDTEEVETTQPADTSDSLSKDDDDILNKILDFEVQFGGAGVDANGQPIAVGLPDYKNKKKWAKEYKEKYLNSKGFKDAKGNSKKGVRTHFENYDKMPYAVKGILAEYNFNAKWDPRVLALRAANVIDDTQRSQFHGDEKALDAFWKKNKDKINWNDPTLLDSLDEEKDRVMQNTWASGEDQSQLPANYVSYGKRKGMWLSDRDRKTQAPVAQVQTAAADTTIAPITPELIKKHPTHASLKNNNPGNIMHGGPFSKYLEKKGFKVQPGSSNRDGTFIKFDSVGDGLKAKLLFWDYQKERGENSPYHRKGEALSLDDSLYLYSGGGPPDKKVYEIKEELKNDENEGITTDVSQAKVDGDGNPIREGYGAKDLKLGEYATESFDSLNQDVYNKIAIAQLKNEDGVMYRHIFGKTSPDQIDIAAYRLDGQKEEEEVVVEEDVKLKYEPEDVTAKQEIPADIEKINVQEYENITPELFTKKKIAKDLEKLYGEMGFMFEEEMEVPNKLAKGRQKLASYIKAKADNGKTIVVRVGEEGLDSERHKLVAFMDQYRLSKIQSGPVEDAHQAYREKYLKLKDEEKVTISQAHGIEKLLEEEFDDDVEWTEEVGLAYEKFRKELVEGGNAEEIVGSIAAWGSTTIPGFFLSSALVGLGIFGEEEDGIVAPLAKMLPEYETKKEEAMNKATEELALEYAREVDRYKKDDSLPKPEAPTKEEVMERAKQMRREELIRNKKSYNIEEYLDENEDINSEKAQELQDIYKVYTLREEQKTNKTLVKDMQELTTNTVAFTQIEEMLPKAVENYKSLEDGPEKEEARQIAITLHEDLVEKLQNIVNISGRIDDNQKKLGDLQEEGDLVRRNYDGLTNAGVRLGTSTLSIISGVAKTVKDVNEMIWVDVPTLITTNTGWDLEEFAHMMETGYGEMEKDLDRFDEYIEEINSTVRRSRSLEDVTSFSDYAQWLGDLGSSQLPQLAAVAGTGGYGLALLASSAYGNKLNQLEKEMGVSQEAYEDLLKEYSALPEGSKEREAMEGELDRTKKQLENFTPLQMRGTAFMVGLGEYASEKITQGILKRSVPSPRLYSTLAKANKGDLSRGFRKGVKDFYNKKITKLGVLRDPLEEGASEVFAQGMENLADKYIMNKDISLTDGMNEAFWSGAAIGAGIKVAGGAMGLIMKPAIADRSAEINANLEKINSLSKDLDRLKGMEPTESIEKDIARIEGDLAKLDYANGRIIASGLDIIDRLSLGEFQELGTLEQEVINVKKDFDSVKKSKTLSPRSKKIQLELLEQKHNDIVLRRDALMKIGKSKDARYMIDGKEVTKAEMSTFIQDEKNLERLARKEGSIDIYNDTELDNQFVKKIKPIQDAIQEPSTKEVDVRQRARDGEEVGVGDTKEQEVTEEVEVEVQEQDVPKGKFEGELREALKDPQKIEESNKEEKEYATEVLENTNSTLDKSIEEVLQDADQYKRMEYKLINKLLREGKAITVENILKEKPKYGKDAAQGVIDNYNAVKDGTQKTTITAKKKPIKLFRNFFKREGADHSFVAGLEVGDTYKDKSFTSATGSKTFFEGNQQSADKVDVKAEIEIPPGSSLNALPVGGVEQEVIIAEDTEFEVVGKSVDKNGVTNLKLRVKPQPKTQEQDVQQKEKVEADIDKYTNPQSKLNTVTQRVNKKEKINEKEMDEAIEEAYDTLDQIEKDENISDDEKDILLELVEEQLQNLESYELITETQTRKIAEERTVRIPKKAKRKTAAEKQFEGKKADYSDNKGGGGRGTIVLVERPDGKEYYVLEGSKRNVMGARPTVSFVLGERGKVFQNATINYNENNEPVSITTKEKGGKQVTIKDPEIAKQFFIEQTKEEDFDQEFFEETYIEFVGQEDVEVLKTEPRKTKKAEPKKAEPVAKAEPKKAEPVAKAEPKKAKFSKAKKAPKKISDSFIAEALEEGMSLEKAQQQAIRDKINASGGFMTMQAAKKEVLEDLDTYIKERYSKNPLLKIEDVAEMQKLAEEFYGESDMMTHELTKVFSNIYDPKEREEFLKDPRRLYEKYKDLDWFDLKAYESDIDLLIDELKKTFPNAEFFTEKAKWDEVMASDDVKQYHREDEIIYGVTTSDGKIYLNPEFRDFNTPIHEAGHVWTDFIKKNNPELYKKGLALVEGTPELKEAQKDLGDTEAAREEALAVLIGNKGDSLVAEVKKKRFKNWLTKLWESVRNAFPILRDLTTSEIQDLTLEDFVGGAVRDILSGKPMEGAKTETTTRPLRARKGRAPKQTKAEALKELRKEFRDKTKAEKQLREDLVKAMRELERKGTITKKQADAIVNRFKNTNVKNPVMRDRFLDYVDKVFTKAEYLEKIKDANTLRKKIKKDSKNKKTDALLTDLGKKFVAIDPSMVEDIDTYIKEANKVLEGLKPSKKRLDVISWRAAPSVQATNEYIEKTMQNQRDNLELEFMIQFEEATGLDASEFSLEEMMEMLAEEQPTEDQKKKLQKREAELRKQINNMQLYYKGILITNMLDKDVDPFTGEELDLTDKQKKIIKGFINMNLEGMPIKEAIAWIDALNNFVTNQSISGLEGVLNRQEGAKEAKDLADAGIKAHPIKLFFSTNIGRIITQSIVNLNVAMEIMFRGVKAAGKVMDAMGLQDFINGAAKAQRMAEDIVTEYADKYKNTNPNGESFFSAQNITERGVLAFMSRTTLEEGGREGEFERRKKLLKESYEVLLNGSEKEVEIGKKQEAAYNKLVKDSNSLEDVISKADNTNKEAVDWWIEEWAKHYSDLSDVSLTVYNKILDKDGNYTPDVFTRLDIAEKQEEGDLLDSAFINTTQRVYDKKTGVLMEASRPQNLPTNTTGDNIGEVNRYISLDFDANNQRTLESALVDINTAAPTQKIKGFTESSAFKKIIPSQKDRTLIKDRIYSYVRKKRGKSFTGDDKFTRILSPLLKPANILAKLGVSRALGGIMQPVKQTIPVAVNTLINSGRINLEVLTNPALREFINKSGYSISNRGITSQANIDKINTAIEKAAESTGGKVFDKLGKINDMWMEVFLVKPDVFIARASWVSYYQQYLAQKGESTNIDWATHKLNKEAANYAQRMVDRQQNVSDADLQGDWMTSQHPAAILTKKWLIPFMNFVLNQKARMYSDTLVLTSKTASKEDKVIAARSLSGLAVESTVFHSLSIGISIGMFNAAAAALGYDEEEEKKDKRINNLFKGRATSIASDLLSPVPMTDPALLGGLNLLVEKLQGDIPDEDKFQFFNKTEQSVLEGMGVYGIGAQKLEELSQIAEMALMGTVTTEYMGKKRTKNIDEGTQDLMKSMLVLSLGYNAGLAPAETGSMLRYMIKIANKQAKTDKQLEKESGSSGRSRSRTRSRTRSRSRSRGRSRR